MADTFHVDPLVKELQSLKITLENNIVHKVVEMCLVPCREIARLLERLLQVFHELFSVKKSVAVL